MPLPRGALSNHTWHLDRQGGKAITYSLRNLPLSQAHTPLSFVYHSSIKWEQMLEWGSLGDGQEFTVLMLLICCSNVSSALAALASPPDTHTHAKAHTHSPLLCIPLLLLCPELTVHSQQNHSSYTQPAGSSAILLSHTLTSSLLAALLFLLPFLLSLSILFSHPLSQTHTHTLSHPLSVPLSLLPANCSLPPPTYGLDREKLLSEGLFHYEAVAHQRRSRSGGWSCGGGRGRRHEMGTMNGPESTLRRERGGWEMTNSQSSWRTPASDCDAAATATIT